MKVGSAVLGLHIAALVAFSMTQGCITTETKGSGRAAARHKGPWKHEVKEKPAGTTQAVSDPMYTGSGQTDVYEPVIIDSGSAAPPAYVAPVTTTSYQNTETYVVQKGDVLSRIAVEFDTTTQTLIDLNNLSNPDVLYVGQELRVPAGSRRKVSTKSSSKPTVKKGGDYVIQPGDTLSGIAVAAGVGLDDLRALNNIQDDKIYAGDTISIPSGGKVPTQTQKSQPKVSEPADVEPTASEPAPTPMVEPGADSGDAGDVQVDAVMDHLVYPDETLDDISLQYNVSKSEIMRLNNISDESSVKEGQRLRIPISE